MAAGAILVGGFGKTPARAQDYQYWYNALSQALNADRKQMEGYAGLAAMADSPDVSAASFYVRDSANTSIDLYKVPVPYTVAIPAISSTLRVVGGLGYGRMTQTFKDAVLGQDATSANSLYTAQLGGALEVPVGNGFRLVPALGLGYVRLENSGSFSGAAVYPALTAAARNVLFNWSTDNLAGSGGIAAGWRGEFEDIRVDAAVGFRYGVVSTIGSSRSYMSYFAHTRSLNSALEVSGPLGASLGAYPLRWVGVASDTWFMNSATSAVGFNNYGELGGAVEADIAGANLPITRLRIGATGIAGDRVSGWRTILAVKF